MERREARKLGLTRYETGRPCKHDHVAKRMVSSGTCCECLRKTVNSDTYRSNKAIIRRKKRMAEKQADGRYNHIKKAWIVKNPEKRKAINTANNAVRDGRLTRQPCEVCGSTTRIHKHHDDYSKPLEVRWLCGKCHYAEHN